MGIVRMNEKGQVTIPREIRDKLHIQKGDPLLVDLDAQGVIRLQPAAVLPVETYSDERVKEFAKENALTVAEKRRFRKLLRG
jgi:AbrB family looped-hinge helix DNA binding protein